MDTRTNDKIQAQLDVLNVGTLKIALANELNDNLGDINLLTRKELVESINF